MKLAMLVYAQRPQRWSDLLKDISPEIMLKHMNSVNGICIVVVEILAAPWEYLSNKASCEALEENYSQYNACVANLVWYSGRILKAMVRGLIALA